MIARKQTPSTLVGISFKGARFHIAQLRRVGETFEVQKSLAIDLSSAPSNANAPALGLELRQALQQHNVKENRCAVALPVQWVLSTTTKIPPLPEADIPGFLTLEAERHFAYDPDSLFVSFSRCRFPSGEEYAHIAGVQRELVLNLLSLLEAARLKPVSFTIGIAAVEMIFRKGSHPELLLVFGQSDIEAGVTCGEGLFAMRSLETVGAEGQVDCDAVGRELRMTLGQLPTELRARMVTARFFGSPELVVRMRTELAARLRSMGIAPEGEAPKEGAFAIAAASAAGYLLGKRPTFEFLPPKVSAWRQFAGQASARKLAWAASIAGALILLLLVAFFIQGWQLSNLQDRWAAMAPRVTQLEDMQQQIKKFRPWFDNSFRSLTILRKLTEAFPVDGVVTAKTLEIRNQSQVICSGIARDNETFLKVLDQLRSTKEVADVKTDQIQNRGKNVLQFTFNFRWVEGGSGEH